MLLSTGNTSQIANLIFGSALLASGNLASAAQSLSASVAAARLNQQVQKQAYLQALEQALPQLGGDYDSAPVNSVAILVGAALSAKQAAVVPQSFTEVSCAAFLICYIHDYCQTITFAIITTVSSTSNTLVLANIVFVSNVTDTDTIIVMMTIMSSISMIVVNCLMRTKGAGINVTALCEVPASAEAISSAASQAVTSATSQAYENQACKSK